MKKLILASLSLSIIALMGSCKGEEKAKETPADVQPDSIAKIVSPDFGEGFATNSNIRYIDQAKLSAEYNLAKDLQDLVVRSESDLQQYHQSRSNEIQKFATEIENKYRNGGYMSQASLEQDQKKLQQMQANAEAGMAKKQQEYQQQVEQLTYNIQLNLQNFLIEYNQEHHYDAILYSSSGAYFNPALDITEEVVEGLNKIYNQYHE